MSTELHYSPFALLVRSGWMGLAAAVVLIDLAAHLRGGFPNPFGLGVVLSAALIAAGLYLVATTMVLTLNLIRHGAVALRQSDEGIFVHTAWFSKIMPWSEISRVALEVRYGKTSRYFVVAIHQHSGMLRVHTVNVRVLADALNVVSDWTHAAEAARVKRGGVPFDVPTSGIAGYNARSQHADIANALALASAKREMAPLG